MSKVEFLDMSKVEFLDEILNNKPITLGKLAYFQDRLRFRIYNLIINEYVKSGITVKQLADRINRTPEDINTLLSTSSEWTLDITSDLLLGISACEFDLLKSPLL